MNNKIFDKITRGINMGNFAKKRSFVENALYGISRYGKLGQVWGKVEKNAPLYLEQECAVLPESASACGPAVPGAGLYADCGLSGRHSGPVVDIQPAKRPVVQAVIPPGRHTDE